MTERWLHLDPFGGAAGDMILGALIDLGVPASVIEQALDAVGLGQLHLDVSDARRHGVGGRRVVVVDEAGTPVDPLERDRTPARGSHQHTPWREIRRRIERAALAQPTRETALRIFTRLAEAEARVHQVPVDEIELHEAGAEDAIADVVGVAAALQHLDVARVTCGPIPLGGREVRSAHGVLPSPAPATALLCLGATTRGIEVDYECTTPTGAAVLTTLAQGYGALPPGVLRGVGVGLGHLDPPARANLLRAYLIEPGKSAHPTSDADGVVELCTNLDDESGEVCADVIERLLEQGALDAWSVPAGMKKGRPAVVLHALVAASAADDAAELLLQQTSTLGVRMHAVQRRTLPRDQIEVETRFGRVRVKRATQGERVLKLKPEFDDCQRLARARGVSLREVQRAAEDAARAGERL